MQTKYSVELVECKSGKVIFESSFEAEDYDSAILLAGKAHYGDNINSFTLDRGLTLGQPNKYAQYGQFGVGGSTRGNVRVTVNEA